MTIAEIEQLQADETEAAALASEADVLLRDLCSVYRCDFTIINEMPNGMWAILPPDSRPLAQVAVRLRADRLPRDLRARVALNVHTLRGIHQFVERQ